MSRRGKKITILAAALALAVLGVTVWLSWPHLRFWWLFESLGLNAQGLPEYRHRQTGIVMVRVPGGTFWMGAQDKDPSGPNYDPDAMSNEGPVHEVTLSPFLIGKYEVTQAQWKAVMGLNPSLFKGDDNRPVECISWDDIQRFEERSGLALPTEAQWEYACRGGTTTPFAGELDDMAWYTKNMGGTTHPVGKKAPNGFGLHDMHGNVVEQCEDMYDPGFYERPEARSADPFSKTDSQWIRVIRGVAYDKEYCRSSYRYSDPPAAHAMPIGFRAAYPLP